MKFKMTIIFLAMVAVCYFIVSKGVIVQEQSYHQFADTRSFFGIPNTMDVLSNIFFLFVGYLGLNEVIIKQKTLSTKKSWFLFFISILLIAPGSAYYHWSPDDFTLVWDRLPMSMGFMAMYIALLSEHIYLKFERLLPLSLILGLASVVVWAITSDLRFYYIVQFSSFITVPLVLLLFQSQFTHKIYYSVALSFYGLAKWTEIKDREIFEFTHQLISGHSLKHIFAAAGLLTLWWMIKCRSALTHKQEVH